MVLLKTLLNYGYYIQLDNATVCDFLIEGDPPTVQHLAVTRGNRTRNVRWTVYVCVCLHATSPCFKCIMKIITVIYLVNNWQKWETHIRDQSDQIQKCIESLNTHFCQQQLNTLCETNSHVCPYFSVTYRSVSAHGFSSSHKLFSRGRSCRYKIWFSSLILFLRT